MPYYTFARDTEPTLGTAHATKADAIAARTGDLCIAFVADILEREAWQNREYRRLQFSPEAGEPDWGSYQKVPFATVYTHYAHIAKGDPGKLAYTPDDTFGHEDRQLVITVGRYLERFGNELGQPKSEWPRLVGMVKAVEGPLKLATTADEIGRVYCADASPNSCMKGGSAWDYKDSPCRAYAGGDLQVAYIGLLDPADPCNDSIAARAVVWPAQKKYVRVYGDENTMIAMLHTEGYERASNWLGAKLRAIPYGNDGYVMPYIDGGIQHADLTDDGKFFTIARNGDFDCANTEGTTGCASRYCANPNCDNAVQEDESYCSGCDDERWVCERCDHESFCSDDQNYNGSQSLCDSCHSEDARKCAACKRDFNPNEWTVRQRRDHACEELCLRCVETHNQCPDCDEWSDDLQCHGGDGDPMCKDCRAIASKPIPRQRASQGVVIRTHTASVGWTETSMLPARLLPPVPVPPPEATIWTTPTPELLQAAQADTWVPPFPDWEAIPQCPCEHCVSWRALQTASVPFVADPIPISNWDWAAGLDEAVQR